MRNDISNKYLQANYNPHTQARVYEPVQLQTNNHFQKEKQTTQKRKFIYEEEEEEESIHTKV